MPAIITSNFRFANSSNFRNSLVGDQLYLFISKSDTWDNTLGGVTDNPPDPLNRQTEFRQAWNDMIAMKQITASDLIGITRRIDWVTGTTYAAWDDRDDDIFDLDYYVLTDQYNVYKCLRAGAGASTVKPQLTTYTPFVTGDGYVWKYMYHIDSSYLDFLTNDYMPAKTVLSDPGSSQPDTEQWDIQENSTGDAGKIYRIVVTNGGSGYTSSPTVTITGDGTGATATANVSGGVITSIDVVESVAGQGSGSGYSNAVVTITDSTGTNATARAVLPPDNGHGTDAERELGSIYSGLAISLIRNEFPELDFVVNNSFRQIGIILNPLNFGTTTVASSTTASALKSMVLTGASGFVVASAVGGSDYMTGTTSGAVAYIDEYDSANGTIKYHQNDKTGYKEFTVGETITGATAGTGVIVSLEDPDVERFSGKILFLENHTPIFRSAQQVEDLKLIIEF